MITPKLNHLLKNRGIKKRDFDFVFQFVNTDCEGKENICEGCYEDTIAIIEYFRVER